MRNEQWLFVEFCRITLYLLHESANAGTKLAGVVRSSNDSIKI